MDGFYIDINFQRVRYVSNDHLIQSFWEFHEILKIIDAVDSFDEPSTVFS